MKVKLITIVSLLLLCCFGGGCASSQDFDDSLGLIVKSHRFSIAGWEFVTIPNEVNKWIFGGQEKIDDETASRRGRRGYQREDIRGR